MYEHLILLFVAFILFAYYVTTKNFAFWKKRNVPYSTPLPFFGNYLEYILLQKSSAIVCQELCKKFRKEPYFGTFYGTEPALVILDPDIIKTVYKKDFYYFNSRELQDYTNKEIVTQNVFFQHGDKWKVIRNNLTPLFSSAKLKNMFYLIEKCAHAFEDTLEYETSKSDVIGARALMIRYTMDCICSCGFGVEAGTLAKNAESNTFTIMGKIIFSNTFRSKISLMMRQMWPRLFYGLGLKLFSTDIDHFFHELLTGVFKSRNYAPNQRHDFVDLLLSLYNNKVMVGDSMSSSKTGVPEKVEIELNDAVLVSQCVAFFGAGFETSASALSHTIYELAKNEKAQKRAQAEVDEYLRNKNNKLSDDCVKELPYLEACVSETLRLYPALPILTREVVENYTFSSGLHLERGTRVHLPVYYCHRNPEYFPDPEAYKPERFLPNAEHEIKPYTYFPFGEGPRTCFGLRLSKLQVIPGLITFLKTYNVEEADGTPQELELEISTLVLQPKSDIPVKLTRRQEGRNYSR